MTPAEQAEIERINQVSAIARTSWLALLGYLAFIGVTLLGVEDADFFVPARQTDLPLVGVHIPTASFFFFAPILGAALYIYLHIHLLKLWNAIADATAEPTDGAPLGDTLNPWLVNDWALTRRGGAFTPARPLRSIGNWASFLLVWAAAPLVLLGFWWRSMPAHNEWLTLLLALCLMLALHAGVTSWRTARAWLAEPRREFDDRGRRRWAVWALAPVLVYVTLLRTEYPLEDTVLWSDLSTLAATDLRNVEMVDLPEGWRPRETARHAFRETWCRSEGLAMAVCDHLPQADRPLPAHAQKEREIWCAAHPPPAGTTCPEVFTGLDARFTADWEEERTSTIAELPQLDLSGSDLRRASGARVTLVGANLSTARLEWADLEGARLEGANFLEAGLEGANLAGAWMERTNLSRARLEGAHLEGARLEGAYLRSTRLDGAHLEGARLEGAHLESARLEEANLEGARLERTNLRSARLEGANLSSARMEGANLQGADFRSSNWGGASIGASPAHAADFRGARGLTQTQLEDLIGSVYTLLPEDRSDTGEPLYIWSCWETPPEGFDALLKHLADPEPFDSQDLRDEFLCGPGNPRHKTGTPLPLDAPYPK